MGGTQTSRGAALAAALAAAVGLCAACGFVPVVPEVAGETVPSEFQLQVEGPSGPVRAKDAKAILARLKAEAPNGDSLARHLAVEQAVGDRPLYTSNKVEILHNGEETFPAMFAAIHAAKNHIHLEYYIFEDIECAGEHLGDLLVAKRAIGVQVAVMYDDVGSIRTPQALFDRLRGSGVQLVAYHPLNLFRAIQRYSLNDRDHRKLLIVDGAVAIVGGINMSSTYESAAPRGRSAGRAPNDAARQFWRDTDLQIAGPVVAELQRLFLGHWVSEGGGTLQDRGFYPPIGAQGPEIVRIIGSGPGKHEARYYVAMLAAMETADAAIWVTTGYFVPTQQEKKELAAAARRRVDVRLLLPSHSDSAPALAVQHSTYGALLKAGVKIYEEDDATLHSKTIVVDNVWSVIGSSNFDQRSVRFNAEVDAVVLGNATGDAFAALFDNDLRHAHAVDLEKWRHRPWSERVKEAFWRVWQWLL